MQKITFISCLNTVVPISCGKSFQTAFKMATRQCEHMGTHISVCNGLIDLKLQEICSNQHINWLRRQV